MLEGKFAFSSDSVLYIKRLTKRGCVFYALHKLEAWVQLFSAEMILQAFFGHFEKTQAQKSSRLKKLKGISCKTLAFS